MQTMMVLVDGDHDGNGYCLQNMQMIVELTNQSL